MTLEASPSADGSAQGRSLATSREGIVKRTLRSLFTRVVRVYFREVEVIGVPPRRDTGARIFVANHVNGLLDPVVVMTMCECPISPVAKSTLWNIPGLRWLLDSANAVPIVRRRDAPGKSAEDNDAIFETIASHLNRSGNVLIFPEGTSHNEPGLLPLKTGAARMLARAESKAASDAVVPLSFQAVALEFDARDTFRSRVLVVFGPPRHLHELRAEQDLGDGTTDDRVTRIARAMQRDLDDLLISAPTWDERRLLTRVARMYALQDRDPTLAGRYQRGLAAEDARALLAERAPTELALIKDLLREYEARLAVAHTSDEWVMGTAELGAPGLPLILRPLAWLGVLLFALPYRLPRWVAVRARGSPDVMSTYKLGVGLAVYPAWWTMLVGCGAYASLRFTTPLAAAALACTLAVAIPVLGALALRWLDERDRESELGRRPDDAMLASLRVQRATLMQRLEALRSPSSATP